MQDYALKKLKLCAIFSSVFALQMSKYAIKLNAKGTQNIKAWLFIRDFLALLRILGNFFVYLLINLSKDLYLFPF